MPKNIRFIEPQVKRIIDTSPTVPRLDPDEVAKALGAEPVSHPVPATLGPVTRYAVRQELFRRLQVQSGSPAPETPTPPGTVPLTSQEWHQLEELARRIAAHTQLSPSPAQVGSAPLSLALRSVAAEPEEKSDTVPTATLVNELAARSTP